MIQYILTDIEGTTTSVSFVYDTLFPYFKDNLTEFVNTHAEKAEVKTQLEKTKAWAKTEENLSLDNQGVIDLLLDWTAQDVKNALLKDMQGMVWAQGYAESKLLGHVYEDVLPKLKEWKDKGLKMGVYSSGSIAAQKLIFGKSILGDLNAYFSHNFDTGIGHKREVNSYIAIASEIGILPKEILFLSDVEAELETAAEAGMQTVQLVRPGTEASTKHKTVTSFGEI